MKISVVIPVYNVAAYLHSCLDSLLAQSYEDWEAICIDDGSTDGSASILDDYAGRDARIRVIHQSNAGVSAARNRALRELSGLWFTFMDGDDVMLPDAMAYYRQIIAEHPSVDAFFLPAPIPFSANAPRDSEGDGVVTVCNAEKKTGAFLWATPGVCGVPYLRLLRTKKYKGVLFPVGVCMMEDKLNLVEVLCVPSIWARANKRVYAYRQRPGSAVSMRTPGRCLENIRTIRRIATGLHDRLQVDDAGFSRYWQSVKPQIECYLDVVFSVGGQVAVEAARECQSMERCFNCNIVNTFCRIKCLILISSGHRIGFALIGYIQAAINKLVSVV